MNSAQADSSSGPTSGPIITGSNLNVLKTHTGLVLASMALLVIALLEIIIKPNSDLYVKQTCYELVYEDETAWSNAFQIGLVAIIALACLTLSRCVAHIARKNKLCKKNAKCPYYVAGLFTSFKDREDSDYKNTLTNILLLILHVTSVVCIFMFYGGINASKATKWVPSDKKDSCEMDDNRASHLTLASGIALVVAILLEVKISHSDWKCKGKCVYSAPYSFSKDQVKTALKNVNGRIQRKEEGFEPYKVVRFLMLLAVAVFIISSFFVSLRPSLDCTETDIRLLLAGVIFSLEAATVSAVRPSHRAKQFITLTATFAVFGYISLNYIHLVSRPAATACTEPKTTNGERTSAQSSLRNLVNLSFIFVLIFAGMEALYIMYNGCKQQKHPGDGDGIEMTGDNPMHDEGADSDELIDDSDATVLMRPRSSKPTSLQFV